MVNIFDYLTWRGDLDFTQSAFNAVDNVIFSQFSYLPFEGIVGAPDEKPITIKDALLKLNEKLQTKAKKKSILMFKEDPQLIEALIASNRFANCRLFGYVNNIDIKREIQFSAISVITNDNSCLIVYRGTDFNFVSWKEDFNMSFVEAIPAQIEAANYLEKIATVVDSPLRVCGHSKGGNMAVYAASQCSINIQKRITDIYSNDAPGFNKRIIESGGFAAIKNRIHSFIPQASVVGLLLEQGSNPTVIKSAKFGLWQHDLYSWEVTHNGMICVDEVTTGSRYVDETLKHWFDNLDKKQREVFVETLYTVLSASEVKSLPELGRSWFQAAGKMLKSLKNIDEPTRKVIGKTIAALFDSAKVNFTLLKPKKPVKNLLVNREI